MTQACKNCRYWDRDDKIEKLKYYSESLINLKLCIKTVQYDEGTEFCRHEGDYSTHIKEQYKDQMMFTKDASDCRADLYTKPEFYCAHFEKVEETIDHG